MDLSLRMGVVVLLSMLGAGGCMAEPTADEDTDQQEINAPQNDGEKTGESADAWGYGGIPAAGYGAPPVASVGAPGAAYGFGFPAAGGGFGFPAAGFGFGLPPAAGYGYGVPPAVSGGVPVAGCNGASCGGCSYGCCAARGGRPGAGHP